MNAFVLWILIAYGSNGAATLARFGNEADCLAAIQATDEALAQRRDVRFFKVCVPMKGAV